VSFIHFGVMLSVVYSIIRCWGVLARGENVAYQRLGKLFGQMPGRLWLISSLLCLLKALCARQQSLIAVWPQLPRLLTSCCCLLVEVFL